MIAPIEQGGCLELTWLPFKNELSAGFMAAANTFIKTSPFFGSGTVTSYFT